MKLMKGYKALTLELASISPLKLVLAGVIYILMMTLCIRFLLAVATQTLFDPPLLQAIKAWGASCILMLSSSVNTLSITKHGWRDIWSEAFYIEVRKRGGASLVAATALIAITWALNDLGPIQPFSVPITASFYVVISLLWVLGLSTHKTKEKWMFGLIGVFTYSLWIGVWNGRFYTSHDDVVTLFGVASLLSLFVLQDKPTKKAPS